VPGRPRLGEGGEGEIVYGKRPVSEAKRGRRRVRNIWTAAELGQAELNRLAGSRDHQGIVAEVDPYPYVEADGLLESESALVVALDQIQDPRNLGAVCRSAEAAGAAGVVIPDRRAATITAAACKASAGAVEHLPVAKVRNLADWLRDAKDASAWVYGAEGSAPSPYTQADFAGRVVLVVGGEGRGLRPRVADSCDLLVSVPMRGSVSSLNVSAAAAVLLFEAVRQRGHL
jgi:23S rRNA (guanosine2251-2'-O)-methyltransferase